MLDAGKNAERHAIPKRLIAFYVVFLTVSLALVIVGLVSLFTSHTFGVDWLLSSRPAALVLTLGSIGLCGMAIMGWRADMRGGPS